MRSDGISFGDIFEKRDRKDRSGLPGFVYDAASAGKSDRQLKVAIVTGEDDFLRKDNLRLKAALDEAGLTRFCLTVLM